MPWAGTVVTTLSDGHVFFLKLHHGTARVALDEAVETFGRSRGPHGVPEMPG